MAALSPAGAATVTSTGYAVGSVGSSAGVGVTEFNAALGGNAIKYFIPLKDSPSGVYGTGGTCSGTGYGTCADSGDGGATLEMVLRFDFAQTLDAGDKTLNIRFEDLDLFPVQDPFLHFESVKVVGETDWISHIFDPRISVSSSLLTLSLLLSGLPADDEFFLVLKFKAASLFNGRNTAEHLIAELTGTAVPLPAAVWLFASAIAGLGGLSRLRRWRAQRLATA